MVYEVCIIEDFIIPNLETKTFGKYLEWKNRDDGIFTVLWSHKSNRKWKKRDFKVFTEWDSVKGRTDQSEPEYFTKAKSRFRSCLTTLTRKGKIEKVEFTKNYRIYRIKNFPKKNKKIKIFKNELVNFQLETEAESCGEISPRSSSCSSDLLNGYSDFDEINSILDKEHFYELFMNNFPNFNDNQNFYNPNLDNDTNPILSDVMIGYNKDVEI